ncbi:MAG: threonine aldolase family protein [Shimia sp.]
MMFASDNAGPVHPAIMDAVARANEGRARPYGADAWTERAEAGLRDLFEAPEAAIFLVATGTAANALGLATLCPPWGTVFCHEAAHIERDEGNAPEFYTHGAKLTLVPGVHGKMTPETLRAAIEGQGTGGVHTASRGPVSITNVTEAGTVYDPDETAALAGVARAFGLPVHLDGARLANACAALDCSPAEATWKAGVDVAVFGGTKNGCLGVEAVIFFDPARAEGFAERRKRGGHLLSKGRTLGAQMDASLEDDRWRDLVRGANVAAARLAAGLADRPGVGLLHPVEANMIFAEWPRAVHRRLIAAGAIYYPGGPVDGDGMQSARLVCDWSVTDDDIAAFLAAMDG